MSKLHLDATLLLNARTLPAGGGQSVRESLLDRIRETLGLWFLEVRPGSGQSLRSSGGIVPREDMLAQFDWESFRIDSVKPKFRQKVRVGTRTVSVSSSTVCRSVPHAQLGFSGLDTLTQYSKEGTLWTIGVLSIRVGASRAPNQENVAECYFIDKTDVGQAPRLHSGGLMSDIVKFFSDVCNIALLAPPEWKLIESLNMTFAADPATRLALLVSRSSIDALWAVVEELRLRNEMLRKELTALGNARAIPEVQPLQGESSEAAEGETQDENERYFYENKDMLLGMYLGQWVAIHDREVIAHDGSLREVNRKMHDVLGPDRGTLTRAVTHAAFDRPAELGVLLP